MRLRRRTAIPAAAFYGLARQSVPLDLARLLARTVDQLQAAQARLSLLIRNSARICCSRAALLFVGRFALSSNNARIDANGNPTEAFDFKGNQLRSTRRLVSDYTAIADWLLNPSLDDETFEGGTRYDALNRPIQSITPHSSLTRAQRPNKINVIQPAFNEANLLEWVDVKGANHWALKDIDA
jgi:hypothetical protein